MLRISGGIYGTGLISRVIGFSFGLWGALEREALARAKWLPSERQIAAADRASDCGVYRSVNLRFQETLNALKQEIEEESKELQVFYASLERCAKDNGMSLGTDDEEREAQVALVCESEYQNWIQRSYRILMLEDERGLARSKRDEANQQLAQCPRGSSRGVSKASVGEF